MYRGTKETVELIHGKAIPTGCLAVENYHTDHQIDCQLNDFTFQRSRFTGKKQKKIVKNHFC